ncbi:MAG: hypothetical protein ACQETH_10690 [Candidatus Rifleibacteriota bacterium]
MSKNKEEVYLKMQKPADMLAVNFLASSGDLKGNFVQEVDPPWTIWWKSVEDQSILGRLGSLIKSGLPQPEEVWDVGRPNGECREISWLDLFRKSVIKPAQSRKVSNEVVLLTTDKEIFYMVVKNHFMLQQGKIEFAAYNAEGREYFLLKIKEPSLWVLNTINKSDWLWFNLVPGQSGIYIEAGYYIHDISSESCFNKFQIAENGVLLIQKSGRLLSLKPKWKKGESLIKVDFAGAEIKQVDAQEKISLKPVLRETERRLLPVLWHVENKEQFKAILLNEKLDPFKHYRLAICKDNSIWVYARSSRADRGLATILTDAFAAYTQTQHRVFVPAGKLLAPGLSSERLHEIVGGSNSDFVIITEWEEQLKPLLIRQEDLQPVEDFITIEAEKAAEKAQTINPSWKFVFRDLKKKKQVIEIDVDEPAYGKLKATSEDGQVASVDEISRRRKRRKKTIDLNNVPELAASETSSLKVELDQIDVQLLQNVGNARLWEQRSEICVKMRMNVSALASLMNAAVLNNDIDILIDCLFEFCSLRSEFAALRQENITEIEKGRLLAAIRNEKVNAEFYYVLMLAYAAKFNDFDIFQQAVSAMKTSFPGEDRKFYGFSEIRSASGGGINVENRVELLTENELPRIRTNVKNFILQLGCGRNIYSMHLARKQLNKILAYHLSPGIADRIVSTIRYTTSDNRGTNEKATGFFNFFWKKIEKWPKSMETGDNRPEVNRWLRLMTMDKIRETPLKDFFTGDLYRPPFYFIRSQENKRNGLLQVNWIKDLSSEEFPEKSDGRSIANAIYYRFADNDADWDKFFRMALSSGDPEALAKAQRLLLLMVSQFGPHPVFKNYIMPARLDQKNDNEQWDIYSLTMYCDMYRLCLVYKQPVDEQRLFNHLINRIPQPPEGWEDFSGSAEWIILCLLLSSSPKRRFLLDTLILRVTRWLDHAFHFYDYKKFAQSLTILSFLSIGILADLVPEKLELHQLLEKRKVIWMEHAFKTAAAGKEAFEQWRESCGF